MTDTNSFIFSLINIDNNPSRMDCSVPERAVHGSAMVIQAYGVTNGGSASLVLWSDYNVNTKSRPDLGDFYKHTKYPHGSKESQGFFGRES